MRKFTKDQDIVTLDVDNIKEMVAKLLELFPGIEKPMVDASGELRKFVNVYVNNEDIRFLQGSETAFKEGDEVSIVPAIAGGI